MVETVETGERIVNFCVDTKLFSLTKFFGLERLHDFQVKL